MSKYIEALKEDSVESKTYYMSSIHRKTEQQKALEKGLILSRNIHPKNIADIACGGGGTVFHLSQLFPKAKFILIDANEDAVDIAKQNTSHLNAECRTGDIYALDLPSNAFDLVICWQTLAWLKDARSALEELVRICMPGGFIYASSLFNLKHDIDIMATVFDHTRPSASRLIGYEYNTYCLATIRKWLNGVANVHFHEFNIQIDLVSNEKGLGTYTV